MEHASAPHPLQIIIGTGNADKVREFQALAQSYPQIQLLKMQRGVPEPVETGTTFAENAILKARYFAAISENITLADDSGLTIAALDGAPGIYTKRFVDEKGGQSGAFHWLEETLQGKSHQAAMVCALALAWPDGTVQVVTEQVDGTLTFPARGTGFGADPIFVPQGYTATFAEDPVLKSRLSHRAKAFHQLIQRCFP